METASTTSNFSNTPKQFDLIITNTKGEHGKIMNVVTKRYKGGYLFLYECVFLDKFGFTYNDTLNYNQFRLFDPFLVNFYSKDKFKKLEQTLYENGLVSLDDCILFKPSPITTSASTDDPVNLTPETDACNEPETNSGITININIENLTINL
jgi:hypothetical protein